MTYHPPNQFEFFEKIGEDWVRQGLVNGHFKGPLKPAAKEWLDGRDKTTGRTDRRWGLWLTCFSVLVVLSLGLAKLMWGMGG
ncbi:MAG: hypothetical protein JWR84_3271 [Caulobacter sp.]|nr:hypothetical protein [Caulobacter sp.]